MTPQQKAAEQANERPWEFLDKTEAEWNEMQEKVDATISECRIEHASNARDAGKPRKAEARSRAADRGPGGGADEGAGFKVG